MSLWCYACQKDSVEIRHLARTARTHHALFWRNCQNAFLTCSISLSAHANIKRISLQSAVTYDNHLTSYTIHLLHNTSLHVRHFTFLLKFFTQSFHVCSLFVSAHKNFTHELHSCLCSNYVVLFTTSLLCGRLFVLVRNCAKPVSNKIM